MRRTLPAVLPAAVAGALAFPPCALADPVPPPSISVCVHIEIGPDATASGCEPPPPDPPAPPPPEETPEIPVEPDEPEEPEEEAPPETSVPPAPPPRPRPAAAPDAPPPPPRTRPEPTPPEPAPPESTPPESTPPAHTAPRAQDAPPRRRNPLGTSLVVVVLAVVISAGTAIAFAR